MELEDGVDLSRKDVDLLGESFRLFWRDVHILHLSCGCVGLQLIGFAGVVFGSEDARRQFAEKLLQQAGVLSPRLLDCSFEFLDLGLRGLVTELTHDGV